MTRLAEWLALAAYQCDYYRPLMIALTAFQAGAGAYLIHALRKIATHKERWALYFSIAFLFFFVQYGVYGFDVIAIKCFHYHLQPSGTAALAVAIWVIALGSNFNNILFLASGRALLLRGVQWPWWAFLAATFSATALVAGQALGQPWYGLPDGLFSAYCVCVLVRGMHACLRPTTRRALRCALVGVAVLYSLIAIVVAFAPYVADSSLWPALSKALERVLQTTEPNAKTHALEGLGIAIAFLPKLGLLGGGFALMLSAIALPWQATNTVTQVTNQRKEFPSTDFFLRALAESVRADSVELCLLTRKHRQARITYWRWVRAGFGESIAREEREVPSQEHSVAGWVISERKPAQSRHYVVDKLSPDAVALAAPSGQAMSVLGVPLRYSGAVIGCLVFWWARPRAISETVRRRAADSVVWFAQVFQTYRVLDALDECTRHLAAAHATGGNWPTQDAIAWLITVVHDYLRPVASGLCMDFGFRSMCVSCADESPLVSAEGGLRAGQLREQVLAMANEGPSGTYDYRPVPLLVPLMPQTPNDTILGELALAVVKDADPPDRPSLASDPLVQRVVASKACDALLAYYRRKFDWALEQLNMGLVLAQKKQTFTTWYDALERCAEGADLAWAVVTLQGTAHYWGPAHAVETVNAAMSLTGQSVGLRNTMRSYVLHDPINGVHHVVRIDLPVAGYYLWLGIARAGFGLELVYSGEHSTPWLLFLERFGDMAGATLASIYAQRDLQRLQFSAVRNQGLATIAAMQGFMSHELRNLSSGIAKVCHTLLDAFAVERLIERNGTESPPPYREMVASMKTSADTMVELTGKILDILKADEYQACCLRSVVERVAELHRTSLQGGDTSLDYNGDLDSKIDLPCDALCLILSTLIENAIEAQPEHLSIIVEAQNVGTHVECRVANNGPAIPAHMWRKIFEAGFTTKGLERRGFGLFLVYRLLRENGGDIKVQDSNDQRTTFLLRLPISRIERT